MSTQGQIPEEKQTVLQLLKGNEWVFGHPILRHIANTAPSPKAADTHLCKILQQLPFVNNVAQAVRKTVKARQIMESNNDWQKAWSMLTQMPFSTENANCDPRHHLGVDVLERLHWHPDFHGTGYLHKPFLLKEFKQGDFSTIPLEPKNDWVNIRTLDEPDISHINFNYSDKSNGNEEFFLSRHCNSVARLHARAGDAYIRIVNTMMTPTEKVIPRFYKVVCINMHELQKDQEEIIIVCPIDRLMFSDKGDQLDGYMVYKKTIELMNGIKAVLRLHFTIQTNGNLLVESRNKPFISINTCSDGFEVTRDKFSALQKTAETNFAELFSLSVSLWEKTDKFNNLHLHQFTDFHVISNPVKNLHELFTRNESS